MENKHLLRVAQQMQRVADILEEILKLVKKDMEPKKNEDKI